MSGVAPFGFFVELRELFVEGLVHARTLTDDHYEHIETQHALRGRRSRRTFRVGDPVTVRRRRRVGRAPADRIRAQCRGEPGSARRGRAK